MEQQLTTEKKWLPTSSKSSTTVTQHLHFSANKTDIRDRERRIIGWLCKRNRLQLNPWRAEEEEEEKVNKQLEHSIAQRHCVKNCLGHNVWVPNSSNPDTSVITSRLHTSPITAAWSYT
jgi:hypothetical protein